MESQTGVECSRQSSEANSNTEQDDRSNLVKTFLERNLDLDYLAKFKQVLDDVGYEIHEKLYESYHLNLLAQLKKEIPILKEHPIKDYSRDQHINKKLSFFAFRFISNIGGYVLQDCLETNAKAEKNFVTLTKILLHHALLAKNDSANLALVELQQLCAIRKITLQTLYYNHKRKYLRLIIKAILQKLKSNSDFVNGNGLNGCNGCSLPTNKGNCIAIYMTRALEVFNIASIKRDEVALALIIITNLVHKDVYNAQIKIFLEYLAIYQNMDLWSLLNIHIQSIMVGLLMKGKLSHLDITAALNKIANFCNRSLDELLEKKISFIKAELLLHYSKNSNCITNSIYYMSRFERKEHEQLYSNELEDIDSFINYLYPDMIGILLGVDSYVTSQREFTIEDRIEHVESLCKLLSLLTEGQIQSIHHKLLSTLILLLNLRTIRDNCSLNQALKDIWLIFVNRLSKELRVSFFLHICVSLHDLLEDCPDVAEIYNIFFQEDVEELKDKLKFLFFIPDIPALHQMYNYLTPHVKRENNVSNIKELQSSLDFLFPLMKLENHKSLQIALVKLKHLIQSNQKLLISSMFSNQDEPLDSVLSKIVESLISLSSTQDSESSDHIAECIGLLGAVNPLRLDHLIYGELKGTSSSTMNTLLNDDFKVELIERLKVSLFSDRINESETANYALQVVIKNSRTFTTTIKPKLSDEAQRACALCQSTQYGGYKKAPSDISSSVYDKFKADNQYSYKDWLEKFSWNLISTIKSGSEQEIFGACSYVFKHNSKFAEYLLPHTITYIIINQPQQIELIRREVMSILDEDVGLSTQDIDDAYSVDLRGNVRTLHLQCANMVFCCLDAVYRLERELSGRNIIRFKDQLLSIKEFNDSIPKDKLALLASKCRSHARSLYYFDQYLFNYKKQFDKYAAAYQRALFALDDTYEAAGVEMMRSLPPTICDDIANLEALGRHDKAFVCCAIALDTIETTLDREAILEDSLKCLSNQGDYLRLHEKTKLMLIEHNQFRRSVLPYAVEATWKLTRWDDLENMFKTEQLDNLLENASVSQGYLIHESLKNSENLSKKLQIVRNKLMKPLNIAMMDQSAYFRAYQSLVTLHSIGDFSLAMETFNQFETLNIDENTIDSMRGLLDGKLDALIDLWNKRNRLVEPSIKTLEPIMIWQRSISIMLSKKYPILTDKINMNIGRMWLSSATLARSAKNFDRAFYCLSQSKKWFGSEFQKLSLDLKVRYNIELAKLEWDQGEQTKAIRNLKLLLDRLKDHQLYKHLEERKIRNSNNQNADSFPQLNNIKPCRNCNTIDQSERESFAELKILLTQYYEEAAAGIPETLFFMYEECVHLGVNQEETYFRLARYYDKLLTYYMENPQLCNEPVEEKNHPDTTQKFSQTLRSADKEEVYTKLMEHSILAFGNSLKYGVRYLRESMPRLLNLWYDLGSKKTPKSQSRIISSRIENTVRFIDDLKKTLPAYYFMSAISLLLSRICHPHSGVSKKTCEIIEYLLTQYPHQLSWQMLAVLNDKDNDDRRRAGRVMMNNIRKKGPGLEKIITDTWDFSRQIIELCIKFSPSDPTFKETNRRKTGIVNLSSISPGLARFDFSKCKVIVPVLESMRAILPADSACSLQNHVAFPQNNGSFISCFQPTIKIFNSLQLPKAISVRCANGKIFSILLKAGDDLRKDSRCTEFLDILNKVLRRNSLSNARFVEIKTFLVLPLESEVGIIEMIPNCEAVRGLVDKLYKERRSDFSLHMTLPKRARDYTPQELHEGFKTILLPKTTPAVLPTWFLRNFTEPTSWYMARLAFTRSTAVISMGGYIIGLGDRHLDNMLIDTCTGQIVHVDFNLLFHQGEFLPTPERVPFRLTHNIVAAFGPVGTEGNFRKVCEITMGVMRKEKDALLTTLKPILHDPCTEWIKVREARDRAYRTDTDEKHGENKSAKYRIQVIEKKLKGYPRSKSFRPLTLIDSYSVEAQVDNLIEEASDSFNLAQMYFGWCSHI